VVKVTLPVSVWTVCVVISMGQIHEGPVDWRCETSSNEYRTSITHPILKRGARNKCW